MMPRLQATTAPGPAPVAVQMPANPAHTDAAVAQAAGAPGATLAPPRPPQAGPDPDLLAGLTFVVVLVFAIPISIAYARRIWRRSARTEVHLPPAMSQRMDSLERGIEAIALEVERIGEGQRFLTQAMADRVALPVGGRRGESAGESDKQ